MADAQIRKKQRKNRRNKKVVCYSQRKKEKDKLLPFISTSWDDCGFCHEGSNEKFGTFFKDSEAKLSAHQFCMLFSAGLPQLGNDSEGFEGFLYHDINKELKRCKNIRCNFCLRGGASIGCFVKSCRVSYHYKCGLQRNVQFEFTDTFKSYCLQHRKVQDVSYLLNASCPQFCPICLDDIDPSASAIMKMPCCKNQFAHKECLQNQAMASGYYFKCPTCKNEKEFQAELARFGIYIPQRDASWENDNAFDYLYEQHDRCDAVVCACPDGRDFDSEEGKWDIVRCHHCGQSARHEYCIGKDKDSEFGYVCCNCRTTNTTATTTTMATTTTLTTTSTLTTMAAVTATSAATATVKCEENESVKLCDRYNVKPCYVLVERISGNLLKKYNIRIRKCVSLEKTEHLHSHKNMNTLAEVRSIAPILELKCPNCSRVFWTARALNYHEKRWCHGNNIKSSQKGDLACTVNYPQPEENKNNFDHVNIEGSRLSSSKTPKNKTRKLGKRKANRFKYVPVKSYSKNRFPLESLSKYPMAASTKIDNSDVPVSEETSLLLQSDCSSLQNKQNPVDNDSDLKQVVKETSDSNDSKSHKEEYETVKIKVEDETSYDDFKFESEEYDADLNEFTNLCEYDSVDSMCAIYNDSTEGTGANKLLVPVAQLCRHSKVLTSKRKKIVSHAPLRSKRRRKSKESIETKLDPRSKITFYFNCSVKQEEEQ